MKKPINGIHFINFSIRMLKNTLSYYRKYKKLQDLAASIGGVLKFLTICSKIILTPFIKYSIYKSKINEFFLNSYREIKRSIKFNVSIAVINVQTDESRFSTNKKTEEDFRDLKIFPLTGHELKKINKLTFSEYLCGKVSKGSRKDHEKFYKFKTVIHKQLDVYTYIRKSCLIDKTMCFLFTPNELSRFEGLPFFCYVNDGKVLAEDSVTNQNYMNLLNELERRCLIMT